MEIVFAGICCWVDAPSPRTGKTVIIRNALAGGTHSGALIPPHHAFIHVKRDQVDSGGWTYDWAGGDDNLLFYLNGDYVTFDPVPSGGSIDLSLVPHVLDAVDTDPICPAAQEIRFGYLENPNAASVLGLVDIPVDADVRSDANLHQAIFATLTMPGAPVTITATPFDGEAPVRSLKVTDPNARMFIANVTLSEYLTGVGALDDSHRYLVCDIFKPKPTESKAALTHSALQSASANSRPKHGKGQSDMLSLDHISLTTLRRAARRNMSDFLDTLAMGCSDSQWP